MLQTKRCPLSLFIAVTLLASTPMLLHAEEIIYNDTPSMLKTDPMNPYGINNSLFPETDLSNNHVTFIRGTIEGRVYGGVTTGNGPVSNNNVTIESGNIGLPDIIFGGNHVYGGLSLGGNAHGNTIIFKDGTAGRLFGGYSIEGDTRDNSVIFSGGIIGDIDGGYSSQGNSNNNKVTVSGGTIGEIYGGSSDTGDSDMTVSGNTVIFTGGTAEDIYGAESFAGQVYNNTVDFSGGIADRVFGGSADIGDVIGNSIIFSGGTTKELIGGYNDEEGSAIGNSISISGGTARWLYGGYSQEDNATSNTINIEGNPIFNASNTFIYGGFTNNSNGDAFSDNILNFSAQPISVNTIANFEQYNFTIDPSLANTATALISAETIELSSDANAPSKVKVVGVHSGNALNAQDEFILMQANSMTGYGIGETSKGVAQQGVSLLYDIQTTVDSAGNIATATILSSTANQTGSSTEIDTESGTGTPAARVNPQLKALSEGYLASAMLVNRGADAIAYDAFNAIKTQSNQSALAPFIMLSGSRNRYNSGSHIKSNDVLFSTGLSYQNNNLTTGVFLEGGRGSYDSYNSFYNAAKVHGDGSSRYFGAGLLGRYEFASSLYSDTSIRFGRTRSKFDSSDLQNIASGEYAKYNLKSNYLSAHIGAGYILAIDKQNTLDLSVKYLHSSVDGKKANVAGDSIHFKPVDSKRVRTDAKLSHAYTETVTFNTGLGYEHEFDGKANATALNFYRIDAPKVKGSTGIFSVGATVKPNDYQNLTLDFNANGYVGKREGVGANISAGYAF